jgi:hypothetical protein
MCPCTRHESMLETGGVVLPILKVSTTWGGDRLAPRYGRFTSDNVHSTPENRKLSGLQCRPRFFGK